MKFRNLALHPSSSDVGPVQYSSSYQSLDWVARARRRPQRWTGQTSRTEISFPWCTALIDWRQSEALDEKMSHIGAQHSRSVSSQYGQSDSLAWDSGNRIKSCDSLYEEFGDHWHNTIENENTTSGQADIEVDRNYLGYSVLRTVALRNKLHTELGGMLTCSEPETCLWIPCLFVRHLYWCVLPYPRSLFLLMNVRFLFP